MEFRLLGPLEVVERDRALAIGSGRQRALLALLLLNANEVVSVDRMVDGLWGGTPPVTAGKILQIYVSRLRRQLGDGRLLTRAPGYVLRADRAELDLGRFEQLVAAARRTDPRSAAAMLRQALALSRGPPLAGLEYEPFARAEIARIDELRWEALELRIDADLACGRHGRLIGELEALIAEHPLRERLRLQSMLALYRSGRQADALAAYRRARTELSERLGLEPGEELKQLERAILQQDPSLDLAGEETGPPRRAPSPERCVLIAPEGLGDVDALVGLAQPLAAAPPVRELVIAAIVAGGEVGTATAALAVRRERLLAGGQPVRTAAFSSPSWGRDVARLAAREPVDLLLIGAPEAGLDGEAAVVLDEAPCDVALFVAGGGAPRAGPVVVPFGAAWHDWGALELGAWMARATGAPLHLIGAATGSANGSRDASRLLADASLIVQRTAGVVAEPRLADAGRRGLLALAPGAGLLVVGLSERWRREGLGRVRAALVEAPPAPTVLVRRGREPGAFVPPEDATRFGWSLTAGPS
jgi:DNA-binding SARP family transcriptional activator